LVAEVPVFTDSSFEPVQAEGQYRHYAIIESSSM
jgi:hypothetical protein